MLQGIDLARPDMLNAPAPSAEGLSKFRQLPVSGASLTGPRDDTLPSLRAVMPKLVARTDVERDFVSGKNHMRLTGKAPPAQNEAVTEPMSG